MQKRGFLLNEHRFKRYNESNFVLIFRQKYPSGGLFLDENECNKSLKKNKFSIIGSINDNFKINNNYHFLLEYPEVDMLIEWEQKLYITSNESDVYENVYNSTFKTFHGLAKSADFPDSTCIDGSVNSWRYAIGTRISYMGKYIPGPYITTGIDVNEVLLWMKYDNVDLLHNLPTLRSFCSNKTSHSKISLFMFCFIFLVTI